MPPNNNQKGSSILPISIIVLILVIVGLFYVFTQKSPTDPINSTNPANTNSSKTAKAQIGYYNFIYPTTLTLTKNGGFEDGTGVNDSITLTHSIPYKHTDPCDFKGDKAQLENLTDFKISMRMFNTDLKTVMQENEGSYVMDNFFKGDIPVTALDADGSPISEYESSIAQTGSLPKDSSKESSLIGYKVTSGVEGCGRDNFYFPMSEQQTLFINRPFISEFSSIVTDGQKYLNLEGVIKPEEADKIFNNILSSIKV